MNGFRVVGVDRSNAATDIRLDPNQAFTIGRTSLPTRDPSVSTRHARLLRKDEVWWIEDAGSTNGTLVRDKDIRQCTAPQQLDTMEAFQVGAGQYAVVSSGWERLLFDDIVVELDVVPTFNAAVASVTSRLVRRVAVRNWGRHDSTPSQLQLVVSDIGRSKLFEVPNLKPGDHFVFSPDFDLDTAALMDVRASEQRVVKLRINNRERVSNQQITILPADRWIREDEHSYRQSLAALVLPNDLLVRQFVQRHIPNLRDGQDAERAVRHVYAALSEEWQIAYRREPPLSGDTSQIVRPPREVLADHSLQHGEGTCLDLGLFIAACLEQLHHQPIIILLHAGTTQHVLVGCWKNAFRRREPILSAEHTGWMDDIVVIDPNGVTNDARYRNNFEDSQGEARRQLDTGTLRFALDVAAARLAGVSPLVLDGEPSLSASTVAARQSADQLARKLGVGPTASILLHGLLSVPNGVTAELFERLGIDPVAARGKIEKVLRPGGAEEPSRNYEQAFRVASSYAKVDGTASVLDSHLLRALLKTGSAPLRALLAAIGTSEERISRALEPLADPRSTVVLSPGARKAQRVLNESLADARYSDSRRAALTVALNEAILSATAVAARELNPAVEEHHLLDALRNSDNEDLVALLASVQLLLEDE